jgi:hypothetical protein
MLIDPIKNGVFTAPGYLHISSTDNQHSFIAAISHTPMGGYSIRVMTSIEAVKEIGEYNSPSG